MKFPKISIVIPVYNEEEKIERCLKTICEQDYKGRIEIVLVDDDSSDRTLELARKFSVKVVRNGKRDYDIGKSLGIQNSTGEYIMFLDADNFLTSKDWITKIISPLLKESTIIGSQPLWFQYSHEQDLFDKYCTLYGITDPLTIYLKKRDRLMLWEKKWKVGTKKEEKDYFVAEFTKENLPTIGSVGFTIKKKYLMETGYKPAFSHLDCMQDLLKLGYNRFALVKLDIIHLHSKNFSDFLGKLNRNFNIFIRDFKKRRYTWEASIGKKMYASFTMGSFFIPFYHSIRGFIAIRDPVWFLHPFVCFIVIANYSYIFFLWKVKQILGRI